VTFVFSSRQWIVLTETDRYNVTLKECDLFITLLIERKPREYNPHDQWSINEEHFKVSTAEKKN
jgi:hypothetical protein